MSPWRLLLTRPSDDSAALAQSLLREGVASASLPLLAIEPLPLSAAMREPIVHLERYAAVIVISKPAARCGLALLADRVAASGPVWFAVGPGTAQVLADGGLQAHFSSQGDDSEALLDHPLLREQLDRSPARVLIMRGEGGREWLGEQLRSRGASVEYLPLYRRLLPSYPAGTLRERIAVERLNGVVVSSGQGFDNLLRLAADDATLLQRVTLFVPSQRVAEIAVAAGAAHVINCAGANAQALIAALRRAPVPRVPADPDKNA